MSNGGKTAGRAERELREIRSSLEEEKAAEAGLRRSRAIFENLFESLPGLFLVLTPDLKIVTANDAYLQATMTRREEIRGRGLFEVFPDNPANAAATGASNLRVSLDRVRQHATADTMAIQKYDVRRPDGVFEERYWSPINSPVFGTNRKIEYIIHRVEDVTEFVRQKAKPAAGDTAEMRARLEQLEATIFRNSQELESANRQLRAANAELAQASRLKDEFLANMSHELRTPLNAILGLSEALLENVAGTLTPRQLKSISTISTSGAHLLELINDILDLSKVEAGKLELNLDTVNLQEFCESCLVFVRTQAMRKKIGVAFEHDERVTKLSADPRRLKQILVNLLTNAVKFTPEGGCIGLTVVASESEGLLRFTVWDTGIGIAPEDQGKLFRAFTQIDSGLSRAQEGTGLGLALVAKLVELHGGSVALESEPAKGSRFIVSMPLALAPLQRHVGSHVPPVAGIARSAPTGPTILLAEDNEANLQRLGRYLEDRGYAMHYAHNGVGAIELARELRPALIVMDLQMPVMDGMTAIRKIRADAALAGVPIVALTALAMPGDRERCLAAGATDYLSKPVNQNGLVALLEKRLSDAGLGSGIYWNGDPLNQTAPRAFCEFPAVPHTSLPS